MSAAKARIEAYEKDIDAAHTRVLEKDAAADRKWQQKTAAAKRKINHEFILIDKYTKERTKSLKKNDDEFKQEMREARDRAQQVYAAAQ